ncbi:MAG: hypothetical protein GY876_04785 [Planctomycetes bacterium]|nr:hypothetical protein [Planctomycetota bacterium]
MMARTAWRGRRGVHGCVVLVCLILAVGALWEGRASQSLPEVGWGEIGVIDPESRDPSMWRLIPGVGPVLAQRLAICGSNRVLTHPFDLPRVDGVGSVLATRIAECVRW